MADLTPEARRAAADALLAYVSRRWVVCDHAQIIDPGGAVDAVVDALAEAPAAGGMTAEDEGRIAELLAMPAALLQPEAIELRSEVQRLRAKLAETTHALEVTGEKVEAMRGQRDRAETERDDAQRAAAVLQSAATEATRRINAALTTAADLHEFNSPEGEHLDGCPGCRLEAELGEARPDPRQEALEGLAVRYDQAFKWLWADAKARATRKEKGQ